MAETKISTFNTDIPYLYQELASGNISTAIGLDPDDDTFKISVQPDIDAYPGDIPSMQIDPVGKISFLPSTYVEVAGSQVTTATITAWENIIALADLSNSSGNEFDLRKSRLGGVITTGDTLGSLVFAGHDGTDYITASQIKSVNSGTVATNRIASNLLFYTHPDSTTASTLRMTIAPTGAVTIAAPDSGTGLTVSGGGVTVSSGNVTLSAGNIGLPTNVANTAGNITINSVIYLNGRGAADSVFLGGTAGGQVFNIANATNNVGIGYQAMAALVSSSTGNVGVGYQALYQLNDISNYNVAVGYQAGGGISTGGNQYNIGIGYRGGYSVTGSASSNIHIGNTGANESNTIRIGTQGTGDNQHNKFYAAGIYNTSVGATSNITLVDSSGQMGGLAGSASTVLVGGTAPSFTGSPSLSGTITAGTGLVATTGGVTATAGGLTVTLGSTTLTPLTAARAGIVKSSTAGVLSALIDSNTDGQVLISSASGAPAWASLSAGTNITITPGANTISIAATAGGGMTWTEVTGTSQSMAVANGYILNNAGLVTATLPSTAAVGDIVALVGKGAGGWKLAQNASQLIHFSSSTTTTGTGGSLASTNQYDCVEVICTVANTTWTVKSSIGNLTVV
jgi:hypothetical protein